MTFFSHRKLQQNNYAATMASRDADKLSTAAAARRSTKVGGANKLLAAAARRGAAGARLYFRDPLLYILPMPCVELETGFR